MYRSCPIVDTVHEVLAFGWHLSQEDKEGDQVTVHGLEFPNTEHERLQAAEVTVDVLTKDTFGSEDQPVLDNVFKVLEMNIAMFRSLRCQCEYNDFFFKLHVYMFARNIDLSQERN